MKIALIALALILPSSLRAESSPSKIKWKVVGHATPTTILRDDIAQPSLHFRQDLEAKFGMRPSAENVRPYESGELPPAAIDLLRTLYDYPDAETFAQTVTELGKRKDNPLIIEALLRAMTGKIRPTTGTIAAIHGKTEETWKGDDTGAIAAATALFRKKPSPSVIEGFLYALVNTASPALKTLIEKQIEFSAAHWNDAKSTPDTKFTRRYQNQVLWFDPHSTLVRETLAYLKNNPAP